MTAPRIAGRLKLRHDLPQIMVAPETLGFAYDVTVSPQQSVGHDREFRSYKAARAYAEHLAHSMGWTLVDHCGEGAAGGGSR